VERENTCPKRGLRPKAQTGAGQTGRVARDVFVQSVVLAVVSNTVEILVGELDYIPAGMYMLGFVVCYVNTGINQIGVSMCNQPCNIQPVKWSVPPYAKCKTCGVVKQVKQ
jgi:hypothetical protein